MKRLLLALALFATGCIAEGAVDDDELELEAQRADRPRILSKIVLGRLYQTGTYTMPGRTHEWAADELRKLHPTYVSGLLRYGPSDKVKPEEMAAYAAVRAATNAKLDVVLNASEYGSWSQLKQHLEHLDAHLSPDIWFFDFYSQGDVRIMEQAIAWAHKEKKGKKQLVGGNFWGMTGVPRGSDFLALDDHDGFEAMLDQVHTLRGKFPLVAHIENNPQNPTTGDDNKNYGMLWMLQFHPKCEADRSAVLTMKDPKTGNDVNVRCADGWTFGQRKNFLEKQVAHRGEGYSVMFPLFFPLVPVKKGEMRAYDGVADGMAAVIAQKM